MYYFFIYICIRIYISLKCLPRLPKSSTHHPSLPNVFPRLHAYKIVFTFLVDCLFHQRWSCIYSCLVRIIQSSLPSALPYFIWVPQLQVLFEDLESMPRHGSNLTQVDRKAVERERRMYMKDLFSRLAFLIPTRPSKVLFYCKVLTTLYSSLYCEVLINELMKLLHEYILICRFRYLSCWIKPSLM